MSTFSVYAKTVDSTNVDSFKKTDEVLAEVVKKALTVAEKTGQFVVEQAPMLLQEFYYWHISKAIIGIILSLLLFFIGRYAPYLWLTKEKTREDNIRFFKRYNNETSSYMKNPSASWILFIILSLASLIIFVSNLYKLVFILVAPKLYLIEYFVK